MKPAKPTGPKEKQGLPPDGPKPLPAPAEAANPAMIELVKVILRTLVKANPECAKACHAALAASKWDDFRKQLLLDFAKRKADAVPPLPKLRPGETPMSAAAGRANEHGEHHPDPEEEKREALEKARELAFKLRWAFALIPSYGDPKLPKDDPKRLAFLFKGNHADPNRRDLLVTVLAQLDDWTPYLDEIRGYGELHDLEFFTRLGRAVEPNQPRAPLFKPEEVFILHCWDHGIGDHLNYVGISEALQARPGIEKLYNTPPLQYWVDQAAADLLNFLFPGQLGSDSLRAYRYRIKTLELTQNRGRARKIRTFEALSFPPIFRPPLG